MSDEQEITPKDDRLAVHLRALGRPRMMVPESVDDAILAAARSRLRRKRYSGIAAAWVAAAAVVLAAGLAVLLPVAQRPAVAPAMSMDVNGDGRVDILDAFALERKIEGGEQLTSKWDINHDGAVDAKDVRAIAMYVVQPAAPMPPRRGAAVELNATEAVARLRAVDVIVDADGRHLAAYQLEMADATGRARIVGIEGGEHAAYNDPPYYDSAAMAQGQLILAAFSTGKELPSGKTRVARVYVQTTADGEPKFHARLIVAATSDGRAFPAQVSVIATGSR